VRPRTAIPILVLSLLVALPQLAQAKHKKRKPAANAAGAAAPAGAAAGSDAAAAPGAPGETAPKKVRHRSWPLPAMGGSASGSPEVLFTFDDGPSGEYTPRVLDTLKKHGVHAIFFMVGNRVSGFGAKDRLAALVSRILDEGNAIGNHTVNHKDLCKKSQADRVTAEIDDNQRLLESLTGMHMVLFRTPYGVRCPQLEDALDARHLHHVHWDIDAQEWKTHNAVRTQEYIIRELGKLGDEQRAVILIHDIHDATAKAMPVVLDWIDAENARRAKKGQHGIRILGPADVALERLDPGVAPILDQTQRAVQGFVPDLSRRLLAPLSGVDPGPHAARL
jgi:peptidoglycan/xylan/chitin deacetylase (PgdA/CDA1 family)